MTQTSTRRFRQSLLPATLATLLSASAAQAGEKMVMAAPMMTEPPAHPISLYVSPSYAYQSYGSFWVGKTKVDLPEDIVRQTSRLFIDLGFADRWHADLSLGYFDVTGPGPDQSGLADTSVGLRYDILREGVDAPFRLSARIGANIPGDYDIGQLSAPGDDAAGADLTFYAGKTLVPGLLNLDGSFGYSVNDNDVPSAFHGDIGLTLTLGGKFNIDTKYRYYGATSGPDISELTTFNDLPKIKETAHVVEVGVSYSFTDRFSARVYGSQVLDGENVGEEATIGGSVTIGF